MHHAAETWSCRNIAVGVISCGFETFSYGKLTSHCLLQPMRSPRILQRRGRDPPPPSQGRGVSREAWLCVPSQTALHSPLPKSMATRSEEDEGCPGNASPWGPSTDNGMIPIGNLPKPRHPPPTGLTHFFHFAIFNVKPRQKQGLAAQTLLPKHAQDKRCLVWEDDGRHSDRGAEHEPRA